MSKHVIHNRIARAGIILGVAAALAVPGVASADRTERVPAPPQTMEGTVVCMGSFVSCLQQCLSIPGSTDFNYVGLNPDSGYGFCNVRP